MEPPVDRFRQAAQAFCAVIEEQRAGDRPAFARRARNAVAGVYLAAALMPRAGPPVRDDDVPDHVGRGGAYKASIRELLGEQDEFVDVFDPTEGKRKAIPRTLAGELVEIYDDLRTALSLLEQQPPPPDALRDIEFAFENHWGKHAVDVLRPLHHLAVRG